MARILVTGGSGLLGRYLSQQLDAVFTWRSCVQPWTHYQLDITDIDNVKYIFGRVKPTHVVHLAAVGDVDWVQNNYLAAKKINMDGLRTVLDATLQYKAKFIYTSSNAVFGGDNPPYSPLSECKPVNPYGKMRRTAEDIITRHRGDWAIVRLFLLYGWQPPGARDNWASRLVGMLGRDETPTLVSDRFWQPSYAGHVAEGLVNLLDSEGIWHMMGADRVTLYEFGKEVACTFGYHPEQVKAILSDDLPPSTAPRPVDSSYDEEAENTIMLPGAEEGLRAMRDE